MAGGGDQRAGASAFTFIGTNAVAPNGLQQFYILSGTNNH